MNRLVQFFFPPSIHTVVPIVADHWSVIPLAAPSATPLPKHYKAPSSKSHVADHSIPSPNPPSLASRSRAQLFKLPHPPSSPFPKSPLSKNPVVDHSTPHTRCTLEPSCKIPLSPLFTSPKIPVAQKPRRWPLKPMCPQAQLQNFPILSLLLSQNPLVLTTFFFFLNLIFMFYI